jgi:hypothetical protein
VSHNPPRCPGEIGISYSLQPFADSGPAVRGPELGRRLNGIAVLQRE